MADKKKTTGPKNKAESTPARDMGRRAGSRKALPQKTRQPKNPWGMVFWIVFFVVIAVLFIYNRDKIRRTLEETRGSTLSAPISAGPLPGETAASESGAAVNAPEPTVPETVTSEPVLNTINSGAESPGGTIQNPAGSSSGEETPALSPAARDLGMYFMTIDRDGTIIRTRVSRSLPVTDAPLLDALSALLAGPVPDEQQQGLISLIPGATRVMSVMARGNTAYINFSEDFLFNTYGVEGYAGALRQVVWTATEFPNIRDVQILIEGRRIDYLGEGVWIGSPVTREMF